MALELAETTRCPYQETVYNISYGFRKVKLQYVRLKNMKAILFVEFYFIAVILNGNQKLRIMLRHILKEVKRIFGIPNFHYYAIGAVLSTIFKRSPLSYKTRKKVDIW